MPSRTSQHLAGLVLVMSLIGPSLRAQAAREYRPEIIVTLPRWHGVGLLVVDEEHLDMHDLAHNERQRGAGIVSPSYEHGFAAVEMREIRQTTGVIEHRWIPTVNTVFALGGGVELRDRVRVELRDIAGSWSRRYQDRAILMRPVDVRGVAYAPYVHYDLSYDTRFAVLNRREAAVGVRIPVGHGMSVDSFLMRQTDTRRDVEALVAAGVILRVAL